MLRISSRFIVSLAFLIPLALGADESSRFSGNLVWAPWGPSNNATETVREIKIVAKKFAFDPESITVQSGDKVRMLVTSADVRHGIKIAAFGVNESNITKDQETLIEFVADKLGTYAIKCSHLCGLGHMSMKGTLTVE